MKNRYLVSTIAFGLAFAAQAATLQERMKYVRAADLEGYAETIGSIRDHQHGEFYTINWSSKADYRLDDMIKANRTGSLGMLFWGLSNLLDDAPFPGIAGLFGCSAFSVTNNVGDHLVGRNFDYDLPMAHVMLHVPADPEKGRYASIGMVDGGWVNYSAGQLDLLKGTNDLSYVALFPYLCMDGMNEKGLMVTVLALDTHERPGTKQQNWVAEQFKPNCTNITTMLAIRYLLDHADSTETAVNMLTNFNYFAGTGLDSLLGPTYDGSMEANYHYLISDSSGDSRVVEWLKPSKSGDTWSAWVKPAKEVTNFFLYDGYGHGSNRWEVLSHALKLNDYNLDDDNAMSLLHAARQESGGGMTSCTHWSVVYNLDKATADVATLGHYTNRIHLALSPEWDELIVKSVFLNNTLLWNTSDEESLNPISDLLTPAQTNAIRSLRDIIGGNLWKMTSEADYKLNDILCNENYRSNEVGTIKFVGDVLLQGASPISLADADYGSTALLVKHSISRLTYGVSTNIIALTLKATKPGVYGSVNYVNAARFPGFVSGALNDGETDLSWAVAFPYFADIGMNEKGLAATLVSIRRDDETLGDQIRKPISGGLALRAVLDTCDTISAAQDLLKDYQLESIADHPVGLMLADATGAISIFPEGAERADGDGGDFAAAASDLRKNGYETDEQIDILRVASIKAQGAACFEPLSLRLAITDGCNWRNQYVSSVPIELGTSKPVDADTIPEVDDATWKVTVDGVDVSKNGGDGKFYVPVDADASKVKFVYVYDGDEGKFFANGTKVSEPLAMAYDQTVGAWKGVASKAEVAQVTIVSEPKVKLGVVAQRYPWNDVLDINYKTKFWPASGYSAAVVVSKGEIVSTNVFDIVGVGEVRGATNLNLKAALAEATFGKATVRMFAIPK